MEKLQSELIPIIVFDDDSAAVLEAINRETSRVASLYQHGRFLAAEATNKNIEILHCVLAQLDSYSAYKDINPTEVGLLKLTRPEHKFLSESRKDYFNNRDNKTNRTTRIIKRMFNFKSIDL